MPAEDSADRPAAPVFVPADGYASMFEDAPAPTTEDLAVLRPAEKPATIRSLPRVPQTAVA